MVKDQEEEQEERHLTSHLKVPENAFHITEDPLPVRPVGLQHLLHAQCGCDSQTLSSLKSKVQILLLVCWVEGVVLDVRW